MQAQRFYCSNCQKPIDEIDPPIVTYFVIGQVPNSGPPILLDEAKVPSFIRELTQPHVSQMRLDFCIPCLAEHLGLKLHKAADDPMYSIEQNKLTATRFNERRQENPNLSDVEVEHLRMERALLALKVGRGAKKAPKLPKPDPALRAMAAGKPRPPDPNALRTVMAKELPAPRGRKRKAKRIMEHIAPPTPAE